jgi:twitching motility two-component system response regulator PilG
MVSSDIATGSTDCTWLRRPFITTRVLNVFDQVAARLPVESRPGAATAMDSSQANQASDADTPVRKVLVVDDSSTVRIQLQLELKPFGVRVDTAESGEQALQLLEEGSSYDLIFLDVVLPGIDGYQICKRVKKNKAIRKTPVVMLTSKSSPFDRVKGALAGCDTYLTKPVAQSAFQNVVKKYLKQP